MLVTILILRACRDFWTLLQLLVLIVFIDVAQVRSVVPGVRTLQISVCHLCVVQQIIILLILCVSHWNLGYHSINVVFNHLTIFIILHIVLRMRLYQTELESIWHLLVTVLHSSDVLSSRANRHNASKLRLTLGLERSFLPRQRL